MDLQTVLHLLAPLLAIGAILLGGAATAFPVYASRGFGLPTHGQNPAYMRSLGARDLFIGLVVMIFYFRGDFLGLGYACLAAALVAGVDFTVTRSAGSLVSWVHLLGLGFFLFYGSLLITGA